MKPNDGATAAVVGAAVVAKPPNVGVAKVACGWDAVAVVPKPNPGALVCGIAPNVGVLVWSEPNAGVA